MQQPLPLQTRGFTIIEIVLVLAIAGLIFLMVFIAFPTLQRNQRDSQRNKELTEVMAVISEYRVNNKRKVPTTQAALDDFTTRYLRTENQPFADPSGKPFRLVLDGTTTSAHIVNDISSSATEVRVWYFPGGKCNGQDVVETSSATAANALVAVRMSIEAGQVICASDS